MLSIADEARRDIEILRRPYQRAGSPGDEVRVRASDTQTMPRRSPSCVGSARQGRPAARDAHGVAGLRQKEAAVHAMCRRLGFWPKASVLGRGGVNSGSIWSI